MIGAVVVFSAAAGHRTDAWYVATGFQKHLVWDNAVWSVAALTIGLAVLPVIAAVAAFLSPALRATHEGRAFVVVGVAAVVVFISYAAVKGAYLAKYFSVLVLERNVIYLVPIVFAAAAALLQRRLATVPALAVRLPRRAVPRRERRVQARPVPVLRGPEPRHRRISRTGSSSGTQPTSSAHLIAAR